MLAQTNWILFQQGGEGSERQGQLKSQGQEENVELTL